MYGYQVERLFSADTAKLWMVTGIETSGVLENPENCQDSLFYLFQVPAEDSLEIFELMRNCAISGDFDSTFLGKARASVSINLFTDSIRFNSGSYWIVENVTSQSAVLKTEDDQTLFLEVF
jgi:hypothetical protein